MNIAHCENITAMGGEKSWDLLASSCENMAWKGDVGDETHVVCQMVTMIVNLTLVHSLDTNFYLIKWLKTNFIIELICY